MFVSQSSPPWYIFAALLLVFNLGAKKPPTLGLSDEVFLVPQIGTPTSISNFLAPAAGCNWSGIGGQLFDSTSNPMPGKIIKLDGTLQGTPINLLGVSGGEIKLGPAGFAFKIADQPVASNATLFMQVLDITGAALTPRMAVQTYADCQRNFILLNVKATLRQNPTFFPMIRK
ncbi:MAG: hypothetical protein M5U05_15265 [Anaerolineales bacterium]|nr:hypothetical protein [Anaerolineales bacterium]